MIVEVLGRTAQTRRQDRMAPGVRRHDSLRCRREFGLAKNERPVAEASSRWMKGGFMGCRIECHTTIWKNGLECSIVLRLEAAQSERVGSL